MKHRFKIKILTGFSCWALLTLMSCCSTEPRGPNPQNYEDYVQERDQYPAFSPDGKYIVYYHYSAKISEPDDYPSGLYIIDADGTNRTKVLSGQYLNPAWSPDGQWLVFSKGGVIQRCRVNSENLSTLTFSEDYYFFPDYSPDGEQVIFDRLVNINGSIMKTKKDLSETPIPLLPLLVSARDPEYSPEGNFIVYMKGSTEWSNWEIFISNINGNSEVRLTDNSNDDVGPTWSPNGDKIAWSSDVVIKTMNKEGKNQFTLSYGQYPSWSSKDVIVFSNANNDFTKEVLYTISPDGSNKKQITF